MNGRLEPATWVTVPRTPPAEVGFGLAIVFSAPRTPPAGAATGAELALCVPFEAFEVLLVEFELVFTLVLEDVFDVVFELDDVFDEVLELELVLVEVGVDVLVFEPVDEPHASAVGTNCVDSTVPTTGWSACFVKCAECVFVITCS